jgi:hypothetical protein
MTKLEIRQRSNDWHVQLEGHPEIWDCGNTLDEALGKWLRTRKGYARVEIIFL